MRLDTGRLRHRITIRRLTDTANGRGGYTRGWANVLANVPAEVISQDGREAVIGRALQGISSFRITIRWRSTDIRPADQIIYAGKELNIRSIADPDGTRVALSILADTETPQEAAL